jgi:hypothetical protein
MLPIACTPPSMGSSQATATCPTVNQFSPLALQSAVTRLLRHSRRRRTRSAVSRPRPKIRPLAAWIVRPFSAVKELSQNGSVQTHAGERKAAKLLGWTLAIVGEVSEEEPGLPGAKARNDPILPRRTQATEELDAPADLHVTPYAASRSVFAAMMKSLRCRPRILCVHQLTVTLPHSVRMAGWWPSDSASSPTRIVKASASAKLSKR